MSHAVFSRYDAYTKKEWKEAMRFVGTLNADWLRESEGFPPEFHAALENLQEQLTVDRALSPNINVAILTIIRDEFLQERLFPELFQIGMPLVNSSNVADWAYLVYRYALLGGGRGEVYDMMRTLTNVTLDWRQPIMALRALNNVDLKHRDYSGKTPLFLVSDMSYGGGVMRSVIEQLLVERLGDEASQEKARQLISVCGVEFIREELFLDAITAVKDGAFQDLVHSRKQVYDLVHMLRDRTTEHFTGSEDGWEPVQ